MWDDGETVSVSAVWPLSGNFADPPFRLKWLDSRPTDPREYKYSISHPGSGRGRTMTTVFAMCFMPVQPTQSFPVSAWSCW